MKYDLFGWKAWVDIVRNDFRWFHENELIRFSERNIAAENEWGTEENEASWLSVVLKEGYEKCQWKKKNIILSKEQI